MTTAETGDELAALALSEIDSQQDEIGQQIVYARVMRALREHPLYKPPKPNDGGIVPMNDAQAKLFEARNLPFGQYVGSYVGDTPIGYLCRLSDPSPFLDDVKRYLASERGKRRIEEGD